jgi:RNA polymerase sigma factor (TIGR02999 family)
MSDTDDHTLTRILRSWQHGDTRAGEVLVPLVYDELRQLAASRLRMERSGHTLQATALVNEAWMRLSRQHEAVWQNRKHFFAIAAQSMRRILVDHARRRQAARRGDGVVHVEADEALAAPLPDDRLIALDEALDRLEALDARQARVVELRFFTGLSVDESARVLDVSPATVKRDWKTARVWLFREMEGA